jgi:hypothetical protein
MAARAFGTAIEELERSPFIPSYRIEGTPGKVEYAVISFGGFLGIGAGYYPIPWSTEGP